MNQRLLLFATILTLPVAGVVLWVVVPESEPAAAREPALAQPAAALGAGPPSHPSEPVRLADQSLADPPNFVRRSDDAVSELPQNALTASVPPTVAIVARFTLLPEGQTATLHEWLRNTPVAPNERAQAFNTQPLRSRAAIVLAGDGGG